MRVKSFTIAIIVLTTGIQTFGQKPWTLTDCINYAYANNIQIKRTQLHADMAKINLTQAYTNILPDVNGSINRTYYFGYSVDPFTNEFLPDNSVIDNYGVTTRVSLFNGLQNYNTIKSNHFASLAALQDVEKEKVENTFNISAAYLAILFQQEMVQVAQSQKEVTRLQVERTQKLVDAGSVAKGDLLEIQAQLANENLNETNALNELKLSVLNLTQLLDLDSAAGFQIVTPDTIYADMLFTLPSVTEVYNDALDFFPHIKSEQYQLASEKSALAVQKGRISPMIYISGGIYTGYSDQRQLIDVENPVEQPIGYVQGNPEQVVVTPGYGYTDYPYSDQFKDNIAKSISIGISIPIFNRWEVMNGISTARIRVEDTEYMLDQVKQQLYKSIQQAHNDAVSANEKYNSAKEAVASNRESFHYTEQKFNVGIVNSVEYNIAKNNYNKAESDLLKAKYEYLFAVKILDFYRGIPITL